MSHECIGIKNESIFLNKEIDKQEKLVNTWNLRFHHSRVQEIHDIEIDNRLCEINNLKTRILELNPNKKNIDITDEIFSKEIDPYKKEQRTYFLKEIGVYTNIRFNELYECITKIEKIVDTSNLKDLYNKLKERHILEISIKDYIIDNLKKRITELEKHEPNDTEKVNIKLIFNKTMKNGKSQIVTLSSNSKKYTPQYDEVGRKWFIPKLNDDSYIKIRFIGKELHGSLIRGISNSSAIIGNTVFSKGNNDDGFILNKRALSLLLIDPRVWFYVLKRTEDIEIIESSEDINATLEII